MAQTRSNPIIPIINNEWFDIAKHEHYWLVAGMSFRQTKFSPLLRGIAAATLFVWLGALALCQIECCSGDEDDSASADHHHADAAPHSHSHDQDHRNASGNQKESSFCLSLKFLLHNSPGLSLSKPAPQPLYELTFAPAAIEDTATLFIGLHFRQAKPGDWVFTPEVCLGPAFRSLAPPSLPIA